MTGNLPQKIKTEEALAVLLVAGAITGVLYLMKRKQPTGYAIYGTYTQEQTQQPVYHERYYPIPQGMIATESPYIEVEPI